MADRPVILLDVMGTLVYDPFWREMPAFFGMSMAELGTRLHRSAWVDFERNLLNEQQFLDRLFADGRRYDQQGLVQAMREAYAWLDGIEPLLSELRARGHTLHLLSNYPIWYQHIEEKLGLSRYAPWSFVSCHTGVRKPDPEAYRGAAQQLGCAPGQLLFVDDRHRNCEAARALGIDAILFEDASKLRAALAERALL